MNIFVLDEKPSVCARYHCDKHVVKMILESAQLLATQFEDPVSMGLPRHTHFNHPCARWVRESPANYIWLMDLFRYLLDEYNFRYGKIHSWERMHESFVFHRPRGEGHITQRPMCMPDEYRLPGDVVESYRNYYRSKQTAFKMVWKNRSEPYWWVERKSNASGT
jgi:hypothetical protein